MSAAASFAFASAVPRARGPRDASTSAPPARVAGGASRSRRSAHRPRAAADADVHHPHDTETSTAEDDLCEGVTLELRVAVSRPLDASIVATRDGTTAEDFLASRAALDAVLSGGPEPPTIVADHPHTWRVKAPGYAGRLFFIGPKVAFNPVNVFGSPSRTGPGRPEPARMRPTSGRA